MVGRPRTVDDGDIFAAVAAVVTQHGPQGLTLAAVAGKVGITAPALTQRFGSKHGLLLAFAEHGSSDVAETFERARRRQASPSAAAVDALVALTSLVGDRRALANNLAMLHLDLTDADLGHHAARQSRAIRTELASLMSEAVDGGELDIGVTPDDLADDLYTTFNGALITWAIDGSGSLRRWLTERLERSLSSHRNTASSD